MEELRIEANGNLGPIDSSRVPRYAGAATYARLPRLDQVAKADVTVVGVPFDSGVSYRPGARFGANHVREASRLLRPYNPAWDVSPFENIQVADAGDMAVNPFNINDAIETIQQNALDLTASGSKLVTLGGDHTIALPLLRAAAERAGGPIAMLHFDAHLDTWDTYFGAEYTHGTPFRRAVEEGILDTEAISHIGTRGPLYGKKDLDDDHRFGFGIVTSADVYYQGVLETVAKVRDRIGNRPLYISVDIDVLDPAHAPGHRHAGSRRPHQPRTAGNHPRVPRHEPRRGRRRRGCPGVRPRRDHRCGGQPCRLRTRDPDGGPRRRGRPLRCPERLRGPGPRPGIPPSAGFASAAAGSPSASTPTESIRTAEPAEALK